MVKLKPPKKPKDEDLTSLDRFERAVTKEVQKREAPTWIDGKPISPNLEARSYFDVYTLDFGRLDHEPPLILAGNDAQIALQASVMRALDQLLVVRGVGPFNFQVWAKQFENGFPAFNGPELQKMRNKKDKEVWPGVKFENRPKIIELQSEKKYSGNKRLSEPNKLSDFDFRLIQFFPNRSNRNYWLLFSGSYREIAAQIINWWNQKSGDIDTGAKPRLTSDISQLSRHPYISLYFRESSRSGRGGTQLETEISFRLMDKQEYEGLIPNASLISLADIKRYAGAVARIFNATPDKPYEIHRGRGSYTYNNWPMGYKLWLLANSSREAERVFRDILKIQSHVFDEIYMGISASRNPAKKYPTTPPKKKILGEEKKMPNERQTGIVTFRWAKLVLPMSKEFFILNSREPRMKVDERLKK